MSHAPTLKRADFVTQAHLHQAWKRAGQDRLDPQLAMERENRVFDQVARCDPTGEGRYLGWLAAWRRRQWQTTGLRAVCSLIELEQLAMALEQFEAVRHHLDTVHRDVNRHRTAQDLLDAVATLNRNDVQHPQQPEHALAELGSDILFDDPEWQLVRLGNHAAARFWGRGTLWCTAVKSSTFFDRYAARGALLVLHTPTGRYQLFTGTGEFRDEADGPADLAATILHAPVALRTILQEYDGRDAP